MTFSNLHYNIALRRENLQILKMKILNYENPIWFWVDQFRKNRRLILNKEQFRPEIANLRVRKTPKRGKTRLLFMFWKIAHYISENDNYLAWSKHPYYRPQNR